MFFTHFLSSSIHEISNLLGIVFPKAMILLNITSGFHKSRNLFVWLTCFFQMASFSKLFITDRPPPDQLSANYCNIMLCFVKRGIGFNTCWLNSFYSYFDSHTWYIHQHLMLLIFVAKATIIYLGISIMFSIKLNTKA